MFQQNSRPVSHYYISGYNLTLNLPPAEAGISANIISKKAWFYPNQRRFCYTGFTLNCYQKLQKSVAEIFSQLIILPYQTTPQID